MISEPLKRGVLACLSMVFLLGILFALNNWIGSGPAIKQLKESVDSVDAKVRNESRDLARIRELEEEVKELRNAQEDETSKRQKLQDKIDSLEEEVNALKQRLR
jgi:septal ring factor EnvC (AmiA/AmiB activator)